MLLLAFNSPFLLPRPACKLPLVRLRCSSSSTPHSPPSPPPSVLAPAPLLDAIVAETGRVRANFFCPGHKQGAEVHPDLQRLLGHAVFTADLPELPALDNLFAPDGVIHEAQQLASDAFTPQGSSTWATHFLVNGSTSGIHAAVLSTSDASSAIILPRNAHQSAVHALVLSGATPIWIDPVYDSRHDLLHGLDPVAIEAALLAAEKPVSAVLVVSPTYHGVLSDIRGISSLVRAHGAALIVDEAHGAHLPFSDQLPECAAACGADIVIQSTHKTLPALTQAAMLHFRRASVDARRVAAALQIVLSSSPSYLMLASLDATRSLMQTRGSELMTRTVSLAQSCAQRISSIEGFSVLGMNGKPAGADSIFALDPTRVTVLLPPHVSGYDIDTHLIDRFGVYAELPSFRHVTFIMTPGTKQRDVDMLVSSLMVYNATTPTAAPFGDVFRMDLSKSHQLRQAMRKTPREAFFAPSKTVDASEAIGRVSAETLCPYPPGIPVIVPGEVITEQSVQVLKGVLTAGGSVSGASDDSLSTLRVCDDA